MITSTHTQGTPMRQGESINLSTGKVTSRLDANSLDALNVALLESMCGWTPEACRANMVTHCNQPGHREA